MFIVSILDDSFPYITGMGYRKLCNFYYDEFEISNFKNTYDGMNIFIKTDLIDDFFKNISHTIKNYYNIYSHNSDINITEKYVQYIDTPYLKKWFAQNVNIKHKKLVPIPIGLANARWPHGNIQILKEIQNEQNKKEQLFYLNVNTSTNVNDRVDCLNNVPIKNEYPKDFKEYLREISKSYFVISPLGNGLDTHRNWESIYLNSVPITIKTELSNYFKYNKLPFHLLNNWSEFNEKDFDEDYFNELMKNFNKSKIEIYLK